MAKKPEDTGRVALIKAVQHPLAFVVFIGLLIQAVLLVLVAKGTEYQGTLVVIGLLVALGVLLAFVIVAAFHPRRAEILFGKAPSADDKVQKLSNQLSDNDLRVLVFVHMYPSFSLQEAVAKAVGEDGRATVAQRIKKYGELGLIAPAYHSYFALTSEGKALASLLERARKIKGEVV